MSAPRIWECLSLAGSSLFWAHADLALAGLGAAGAVPPDTTASQSWTEDVALDQNSYSAWS